MAVADFFQVEVWTSSTALCVHTFHNCGSISGFWWALYLTSVLRMLLDSLMLGNLVLAHPLHQLSLTVGRGTDSHKPGRLAAVVLLLYSPFPPTS